ncbi:helix-turn-helix domain-containing protein [Streptomyces sp. NPDC059517]|uniref:helix-turn-helix domain-containing protein n=1 Tax=Streptomyces sp. NPDC059517 TaxID=3346855 RepID=UPI0036CBE8B0
MTGAVPSPPGARLCVVLQQLKQRSGLSLAQLANVTTFSKSSWERYLNGKSLPPRSAVMELCRLVGESADHPLALLDIARTHRTHRTHGTPGTPGTPGTKAAPQNETAPDANAPSGTTPPDTGPTATPPDGVDLTGTRTRTRSRTRTRPTSHRPVAVLTALVSVCAVVVGTLVLINLPPSHGMEASPSPAPPSATGALCRHNACQDKDPIAMRCGAQPTTLAEHETATGAWIQIRYSEECGASWARMWGAAVNDRIELRTGGRDGSRHGARVTSRNEADTYVHTLMSVAGPGTAMQVCFSPVTGGAKECFRTRRDESVAPSATAASTS